MTQLIVALDSPDPWETYQPLHHLVTWFKIGPQRILHPNAKNVIDHARFTGRKIFLDLKLADTADTVRETVHWCEKYGVTAISTFTGAATRAALDAGTNVAVWQVHGLTDDPTPRELIWVPGVICSSTLVPDYVALRKALSPTSRLPYPIDIVTPAVRLNGEETHGHSPELVATPAWAKAQGATHVVVGRPIWQSASPVEAAVHYLEALA